MSKIPLSVAIIVKNDALRLSKCLQSLQFCDDIVVVVDSVSTDASKEVALQAGCRVFVENWQGFGKQKQSAISKCKHDWILIIDSDEVIPPQTRDVIIDIVTGNPEAQVYSFTRKNFYKGKWIRHCGWWPDRVVRLFKKGFAEMSPADVHETLIVKGRLQSLDCYIEHHSITDLQTIIYKVNHYSTLNAWMLYKQGKDSTTLKAFFKGLVAFLKLYVMRLGFLDGYEGFVISFSHGVGTCYKYLKLIELHKDS